MLRASAQANHIDLDLAAIADPSRNPLVPAGRELLAFVDAAVLRDEDERPAAQEALVAAVGEAGTVRAAAVAGNFEMMNRLLDAAGVPPPERVRPIAADLGVAYPPG